MSTVLFFLIGHNAKVAGFFYWKEISVAVVLHGNLPCSPRESHILFRIIDTQQFHMNASCGLFHPVIRQSAHWTINNAHY